MASRSPLAASVAMFAGIVVLRFSAHVPQRSGILLLLIAPIVLISLSYRPLAGVVVATFASAAYLIGQIVDAGGLDAIGPATRAFTYYAIPLTIWLARKDAERRVGEGLGVSPASEGAGEPAAKPLTTRELEVLGLVAAGHTNAQIAEMLVLSVRTIESHRASLRRKLGRPSQAELMLHAAHQGALPGDYVLTPPDAVAPIGLARPQSGLLNTQVQ